MMDVQVDIGDVIAAAALFLSGYAAWTTTKFNERQKSLIESQEKLNAVLLEKEFLERDNDKKADLGATFVKLGSNKYRLKIWNKGKGQARNVKIEFPDGNDIVSRNDINAKFPLETLDEYQSVELIASVHMGTKGKHTVKLIWADDSKDHNEKTTYPTI